MRTIAIANHKGGVGKTATAHALGVSLAAMGLRVLLVDCDPQSSLTQATGGGDCAGRSLAEVLGGAQPGKMPLANVIVDLGGGLSLAPADIALTTTELALTSRLGRESVLKRALASIAARYDLALLDCAPSLGLLTVGALVAADGVLIPTQPQITDLRGLKLFMDTLAVIQAELNPELETLGVLVTFYDARLKHHKQALDFMGSAGLPVLPVMIGRSVRVADAAGVGLSIVTYDPGNPQAAAYQSLAEIIYQWLRKQPT